MLREKIKTERLKQGFSVYKLAKESELQRTQLGNYLKGLQDLQGENIDKLLKALKIEFKNQKIMTYNEFIENKKHLLGSFGFEPNFIPEKIFRRNAK